jgi:hypothetical protein
VGNTDEKITILQISLFSLHGVLGLLRGLILNERCAGFTGGSAQASAQRLLLATAEVRQVDADRLLSVLSSASLARTTVLNLRMCHPLVTGFPA